MSLFAIARCYRREHAGFGCFETENIRMTACRGRVRATEPRRTSIGPSGILPIRFAWQMVGFSGSIRQPCGVGFSIIPTDANSGMIVLLRIYRVAPILVCRDLVLGARPVFATAGFVVACHHDKGGVMFTGHFVFSQRKCRDTDAADGAARVCTLWRRILRLRHKGRAEHQEVATRNLEYFWTIGTVAEGSEIGAAEADPTTGKIVAAMTAANFVIR